MNPTIIKLQADSIIYLPAGYGITLDPSSYFPIHLHIYDTIKYRLPLVQPGSRRGYKQLIQIWIQSVTRGRYCGNVLGRLEADTAISKTVLYRDLPPLCTVTYIKQFEDRWFIARNTVLERLVFRLFPFNCRLLCHFTLWVLALRIPLERFPRCHVDDTVPGLLGDTLHPI